MSAGTSGSSPVANVALVDFAPSGDGGKRRKLSRTSTDTEVKQAVKDNFKSYTHEEIYCQNDPDGKTTAIKIADRKRLNRVDPQAFSCGKTFTMNLNLNGVYLTLPRWFSWQRTLMSPSLNLS